MAPSRDIWCILTVAPATIWDINLGMAQGSRRTPWRVSRRGPWGCPTPRWCNTRSGLSPPPRGRCSPPPSCWRECEAGQSKFNFMKILFLSLIIFHSIVNIVFDLQSNIFSVNYRRYIRCKHKTHTYYRVFFLGKRKCKNKTNLGLIVFMSHRGRCKKKIESHLTDSLPCWLQINC